MKMTASAATLQQVFARYVEQLTAVGIERAEGEVELILCHVLGVRRLTLYLDGDKLLSEDALLRVAEIVKRRVTRYPLQYILEESWFYGRSFFVSPAVMVPTPETEVLIEAAMGFVRKQDYAKPNILDLGVGSGVISITLANELADCSIKALDLSTEAIEVARHNARKLGGEDKIEFVQSDFFAAVNPDERFDLILSNPPYISDSEYKDLPPEVLADPKLALTSGEEGLDAIKVIIDQAPYYLADGGRIMFEIGYNQADRVAELTAGDDRFTSFVLLKDLNDIDRVVILGCD